MAAPYVPLRIQSCYSMLEGAIEPKAIAERARALGLPAAALTDRNGLYAAMPFTDGRASSRGCSRSSARSWGRPRGPPGADRLAAALRPGRCGYTNLCALFFRATSIAADGASHVPLGRWPAHGRLVALTGGGRGAAGCWPRAAPAAKLLDELEAFFPGRLYSSLGRRGNAVRRRRSR
jgi:DNA polymerase-3 subunit alpha